MEYSFVITQDNHLLEQYYRLRESCFRQELGIPRFDGSEEGFDREGTILLAVGRGGRVLAGARIYGNHPGQGRRLPIESQRFRLRNYFPGLDLGWRPYCHWGRLVIDPEVRSQSFSKDFLGRLLDCSATLGYHFAFIVTDQKRSRYYRLLHKLLGYDYRISGSEVPGADQQFSTLEQKVSYAVLPSGDSAAVPKHPRRCRKTFLRELGIGNEASHDWRPHLVVANDSGEEVQPGEGQLTV